MQSKVTVPQHVTIIMDGNGRWAQSKGLSRIEGHREGVESVREAIEYSATVGIKYLSLYAFSTENWNRPKDEVNALFILFMNSVSIEVPKLVKNNVRIKFIGDFTKFSQEMVLSIEDAEAQTAHCTALTVVVALSYSGRWDIENAATLYARALAQASGEISFKFEDFLSTAGIPDPDLMIRTSGEERISNYMLWQMAYTELYFTSVFWPDFRKGEFEAALEAYTLRSRRFGKTQEQVCE